MYAKKAILGLGLGALIASPLAAWADTTVYGRVRLSVTYEQDDAGKTSNGGDGQDSNWNVVNHSSRLGFRGEEDLGDGLSAVYQYEFGVAAATDAQLGGSEVGGRLAYVGLKGNWGKITVGRQWNPYYDAVGTAVDIFQAGFSANGYYGGGGVTRSGNLVTYQTPTWSGFRAYGTLEMNGAQGESGVDVAQVAAIFNNGPFFFGAAYRNTGEKANSSIDVGGVTFEEPLQQFGISAQFTFGDFRFVGDLQVRDDNGLHYDNQLSGDLVVEYNFGNNIVRGSYFQVGDSDQQGPVLGIEKSSDGYNGFILGLEHHFSDRTRVFAEYGYQGESNGRNPETGVRWVLKDTQFALGLRHDF